METKKLKCPFCKNERFTRKASVVIEMFEETDLEGNKTIRDDVISEDYEDYFCSECDKVVTEEELVRE